ncbi:hypothetical protein [Streptomyces sp. NPDC051572]|uniref:hypothetical protein n=1 Tax=Streptomyces sp. NPDC051572 TaxID=3155802 RepID=UPI00344D644D
MRMNEQHRHRTFETQRAVTRLSTLLWAGLWPDDDVSRDSAQSRVMLGELPSVEARIPAVTETTDVAVDDLLVILDMTGTSVAYDVLGILTGREVMAFSPAPKVAKVVATTAKTVTAVMIPTPHDGWECNLDGFAERSYDPTPTMLTLKAKTRRIGRLGTAVGIRQQITDHPLFNEWQRAYAEAKTTQQEAKEAAAAHATATQLRQQALQRISAIVNRALDFHVIAETIEGHMYLNGSDYYHFFRKPERLRVHLAGLRAVDKLTDAEYELVTDQLTVVGMLPAPQGA